MKQQLVGNAEGAGAEMLAAHYLADRGYKVLDRNYRSRRGELDLVVEKESEVAFVEVRFRKSRAFGTPEETVTPSKQRKLTLAAIDYVAERPVSDKSLRFDVLSLYRRGKALVFEHFENAFEPCLGRNMAFCI